MIKNLLVAVSVLLLVALFITQDKNEIIQGAENAAYDFGVRATRRLTDDRVMVVAIDNKSLNRLGPWPWPEKRFADLIDILSQGGPKLIVNSVLFSENKLGSGDESAGKALRYMQNSGMEEGVLQALKGTPPLFQQVEKQFSTLKQILSGSSSGSEEHQSLAAAYKRAGNVVQAMDVKLSGTLPLSGAATIPDYLLKNEGAGLLGLNLFNTQPAQGKFLALPPPSIGDQAVALGFIPAEFRSGERVRKSRLVVEYSGLQLPSLALVAVAKSQKIPLSEVENLGEYLTIGSLSVAIDSDFQIYPYFYDDKSGESPFAKVSFSDLLDGNIKPDLFLNKIVLIGTTAKSISPVVSTPNLVASAPVEILGHQIASLLNQDYYRVLVRADGFKTVLYVGVGLFLLLMLPLLSKGIGLLITTLIGVLFFVFHYQLMTRYALWVPLMGPFLLLVTGSLLTLILRPEQPKSVKLPGSVDDVDASNRMLGLAFQGQGQLALAFSKFKSCKLNPLLMEILYTLALEFEQEKQIEKAGEVFRYMLTYDSNYRDVAKRLKEHQKLMTTTEKQEEPALTAQQSVISVDEYQLDEELGQGSIGTVFLGRAPHDNRQVAVKVIPLAEIFESSVLAAANKRFFEILKVTKSLEHPNIINVLHGGESFGRAFFSMEYHPGKSLLEFVEKKNLLPTPLVIQLIAKIAMALDYAHQKGVVHGDLKSSNLLVDLDKRDVKVTNFALSGLIHMEGGRLVSVRSQLIPYHLAPECANGAPPDHRSDLFSLGVVFYRLLTGEVPFDVDENVYSDHEYNLIYDPPKPVSSFNRELPPCLDGVILKSLQIDSAKRFQRGAAFARALVDCVKSQVTSPEVRITDKESV